MAVKKMAKGWSLSVENIMALKAEAWERSLRREDGKTVSASAVLDDLVTAWRKGRERQAKVNETVKKVKHGESRSGV